MNQILSRKFMLPFSLFVVALVVVIGGVLLLSKQTTQAPEPQPTLSRIPISNPSPFPTPRTQSEIDIETEAKLQELGLTMDDVKLYKNEELGFFFLYPIIEEDNNVEIVNTKSTLGGGDRRDLQFSLSYCNLIDCRLSVDLFGEKSPVRSVGQLKNYGYDYPFVDENKVDLKKEHSKVNGLDALETSFQISDENGMGKMGSYIQFIHDGILYTFYSFDEDPLYKSVFQISFTFLE